jgi:hypothetical protein
MRKVVPFLQVVVVVLAFALPFFSFWLPVEYEKMWRRLPTSEPVVGILGGEIEAEQLTKVYVVEQTGAIQRCNFDTQECADTAQVCYSEVWRCDGVLPNEVDLLYSGQEDDSICHYRNDGLVHPPSLEIAHEKQARFHHLYHCNSVRPPTNSYLILDDTGAVWQSRVRHDDKGERGIVLMVSTLCTGLLGVAVAITMGRLLARIRLKHLVGSS